jgi:TRAP transporter TAXI family solute receptor
MAAGGKRPDEDKGMRKSARAVPWCAAALALLLWPAFSRADDALRFFRIGTAATTGTYFQIGGMLANVISKPPGSRDCDEGGSCGVPGLVAVAQATPGSAENAADVASGQIESALIQADIAHWAFAGSWPKDPSCAAPAPAPAPVAEQQNQGVPPNESAPQSQETQQGPPAGTTIRQRGPFKNLRVISSLFPEYVHVMVRAESDIRSLADLKDKRVALGEPGSGTLEDSRLVLEAAGLSECDLKPSYLRLSEAAEALRRGDIDALFLVAGYPVPAVADLASLAKMRLVPVPAGMARALHAQYRFFAAGAIPGATYPGIDKETPSVAVTALWVTRTETPEDLVYAITAALWQPASRRILDSGHPAGKRIRLAGALLGFDLPLHPGSARYYRENGLITKP